MAAARAPRRGRDMAPPRTYAEAVKSASDWQFLKSLKYREQQLRAVRENADPRILAFADKLVARAAKYGIPLFPHEFWRGPARQAKLKAQGFSRAKFGSSAHNYGMAVDVVHGTRAWDLHAREWTVIGRLGIEVANAMNVKVQWGGAWEFYDPAHWELADWKQAVSRR